MHNEIRNALSLLARSDRFGAHLMRIAIAIVFFWIGALKFVPWVPALGDAQHGFPYLSGAGRLVLKDVMILAGALLVMADSARAMLEYQPAAVPAGSGEAGKLWRTS